MTRDNTNLTKQLTIDESKRNKMYLDSNKIPTIGIGHNLRDKPISDAAVMQIFNDDVQDTIDDVNAHLLWFTNLNPIRQDVLLNMCFNLGIGGLLKFKDTLALIQQGKYSEAANAMLQSTWATQVGDRAKRLSDIMRNGTL